MGTCCCGNQPPEKLVGTWTDNQYVTLKIDQSGIIDYKKQTQHSNASFMGPTRFNNDKFCFCCCCCSLRGEYHDQDGMEPRLIANGAELTRQ